MSKNVVWILTKYLLALGVLCAVFYFNWESEGGRGLGDVWRFHFVEGNPVDWPLLGLGVLLHALGLGAILLRWYLLVRAQDLPFTLLQAARLGTLGMLCNAFLPGSVGGDFVKATALARGQSRRTVAVATVVMDRLMSLWGLILLVASVGTVSWTLGAIEEEALMASQAVIVICVVVVLFSALVWMLMAFWSAERIGHASDRLKCIPKIGGAIAQLWLAVWLYRQRSASVAWAIVLSAVSSSADIVAFYCYVLVLWDGASSNPLPSFAGHWLLVPMALVISAVPLFPGGAGIGEAGFGGLYRIFGSAPANGVIGSLLFRVSGWCLGILGYIVFSTAFSNVENIRIDEHE